MKNSKYIYLSVDFGHGKSESVLFMINRQHNLLIPLSTKAYGKKIQAIHPISTLLAQKPKTASAADRKIKTQAEPVDRDRNKETQAATRRLDGNQLTFLP